MSSALFWLWLQSRLGIASRYVSDVISQPGGARFIYERSIEELFALGLFPPAVIDRLCDRDLSAAEEIYVRCLGLGYSVVTPESPEYPDRLRSIYAPPAVLYCQGQMPDMNNSLCIGIVGTRKATAAGAVTAQRLAYDLARAGTVVVSGCAAGIDAAAHQGALSGSGETVAVLGCGIDFPYNARTKELRRRIPTHGAIISEYPPGTPARPANFPLRNRILSGLSHGVIVAEAGTRSGSMITARLALEQNRDVFAVPGADGLETSAGVNNLIKQGARPVRTADDVLAEYPQFLRGMRLEPHKKTVPAPEPALPGRLSPDAAALYAVMSDTPEPIDELAVRAGLTSAKASTAVLELELEGLVTSSAGRRYSK